MSKILSPSELNEVKIFAEKLGFIMNPHITIFFKNNDKTGIGVNYYIDMGSGHVRINLPNKSITTDEYEDFIKVLGEAQTIAREMEK